MHPDVGELILDHISLELPGERDMRMTVLTAAPGSESEEKLKRLCSPPATSGRNV